MLPTHPQSRRPARRSKEAGATYIWQGTADPPDKYMPHAALDTYCQVLVPTVTPAHPQSRRPARRHRRWRRGRCPGSCRARRSAGRAPSTRPRLCGGRAWAGAGQGGGVPRGGEVARCGKEKAGSHGWAATAAAQASAGIVMQGERLGGRSSAGQSGGSAALQGANVAGELCRSACTHQSPAQPGAPRPRRPALQRVQGREYGVRVRASQPNLAKGVGGRRSEQ